MFVNNKVNISLFFKPNSIFIVILTCHDWKIIYIFHVVLLKLLLTFIHLVRRNGFTKFILTLISHILLEDCKLTIISINCFRAVLDLTAYWHVKFPLGNDITYPKRNLLLEFCFTAIFQTTSLYRRWTVHDFETRSILLYKALMRVKIQRRCVFIITLNNELFVFEYYRKYKIRIHILSVVNKEYNLKLWFKRRKF